MDTEPRLFKIPVEYKQQVSELQNAVSARLRSAGHMNYQIYSLFDGHSLFIHVLCPEEIAPGTLSPIVNPKIPFVIEKGKPGLF